MPRIRTVKPELPEDEKLGRVSREARLAFLLLITRADDHGRFRAAPALLRGLLFPYDDDVTAKEVDVWVGELVEQGMVRLYEQGGERFGVLVNWGKHQRVDNAAKSLLPSPPDPDSVPAAETLGEPRRDSAACGDPPLDLDLGPRTMDLGSGPTPSSSFSLALVPASQAVPQAAPVDRVFAAWQESAGKPRAKLDPKRRKVIQAALRQYPLDDVLDAVRGWRHSPHHRGENDRRTVYNDLSLLLRDAARIEQFRDLERDGPPAVAPSVPKAWANIESFAGRPL